MTKEHYGIKFEHCHDEDINYIYRRYGELRFRVREAQNLCIDCGPQNSGVGAILKTEMAGLEKQIQDAETPAEKEKLEIFRDLIRRGYDHNTDELVELQTAFELVKAAREK